MESPEPSPKKPQESEKSVSRNPFTNLRTLLKGKLPQMNVPKPGNSFWRWLTVISLGLNLILIFGLITLGNSLFGIKDAFDPSALDQANKALQFDEGATLSTSIRVQDDVPVTVEVPLKRNTRVSLSEPARIEGTSLSIRSATLSIDAPATLTLPVGAELPLALDLSVTVDTVVPIDLTVPVEFPIAESEVGDSLNAMQAVLEPYRSIVSEVPGCWGMLLWGGECP